MAILTEDEAIEASRASIGRGGWDGDRCRTYLYVVGEVGVSRPVKIGYTVSHANRLTCLQSGNPRPLEIKAKWSFGTLQAARTAEQLAHEHFASVRLHSEWFDVEAAEAQKYIWEAFMWRMAQPHPKQVGWNFNRTWDTSGGETGC